MKELRQHIRLIPVGQSVTDPFDLMSDQPFQLEFQCQVDDNGTYWNCEKTITIVMPDAATLRFLSIVRQCIVRVRDNDGVQHDIGSKDVPMRAVVTKMLNTAQLQLRGEMPWNPLG